MSHCRWHRGPISLFEHVRDSYSRLVAALAEQKVTDEYMTLDIQLERSKLDLNIYYQGQLIKLVNKKNGGSKSSSVFIPQASSVACFQEENTSCLQTTFDY